MKTRDDILEQAFYECLNEMYKWAQPSIDFNALRTGDFKDDKEHPLWEKHYLSQDNYTYIKDAYASMYGITDEWDDTFNVIYNQLEKGGIEDDYKAATKDRPGYRDYKKVDSLKEHLSEKDYSTVIEYIKKIQNFFKGHSQETSKFSLTLALTCSPTSNPKSVLEYWKTHGRPDFKIKEFFVDDVIYKAEGYENTTEEEFINTLK